MPRALITGSNRGLGLEWARQLADADWEVLATCRDPERADDLTALAARYPKVSRHPLDVTRAEQLAALRRTLGSLSIDVLINNAGIYRERWGRDKLGALDYAAWEETFRVNTLGAVRVTEALLENVAGSERRLVVVISSHMGSIADIDSPNDYAYRSSKAALNATMKGMARELADRSIGVLLLHPGWVRTRMGGGSAPIEPEESVRGMLGLVEAFRSEMSGRFFRYDASELPW